MIYWKNKILIYIKSIPNIKYNLWDLYKFINVWALLEIIFQTLTNTFNHPKITPKHIFKYKYDKYTML